MGEDPITVDHTRLMNLAEQETMTMTQLEVGPTNYASNKDALPATGESLDAMTREYAIGEFNVSQTSVSIYPFADLFVKSRLLALYASKFTSFRCDGVKIKLKLVSAATDFGVVYGIGIPFEIMDDPAYGSPSLEEQYKINAPTNSFHLAISDQEGIEIHVPWGSPQNCILMDSTFVDALKDFYRIVFYSPFNDNISDPTSTPFIQVYAQFINPVVVGPRSDPVDFFPTSSRMLPSRNTAKSTTKVVRGRRVPRGVPTKLAEEVFDQRDLHMHPAGAEPVAAAGAEIGAMAGVIGVTEGLRLFNTFTTTATKAKQAFDGLRNAYSSEQETANEGGNRTGVKQQVYGDLSTFTHDCSYSAPADMQQSGVVSGAMLGLDADPITDLLELCKLWYIRQLGLFNVDTVWAIPVAPIAPAVLTDSFDAPIESHGYLPRIAQFYNFYRGTLRIKIKVFSSQLITWRLIFQTYYNFAEFQGKPTPTASELFAKAGDVLTEIVTVKGNDTFTFDVPFIREGQLQRCDDLYNIPVVFIGALAVSPPTIASGNTQCWIQVEQCAGDDFFFSRFVGDKHFDTSVVDAGDAHGRINDSDSTAEDTAISVMDGNPPQGPFFAHYRSPTSIYQLLMRPSFLMNQDQIHLPGKYQGMGASLTFDVAWGESTLLDKIAYFYLYYNGPTQHRLYFKDFGAYTSTAMTMNNPFVRTSGVDTLDNVEWGTARTETAIWPVLEAERPYICERPFYTSGFHYTAEFYCVKPQNFNVTFRDETGEQVSAADINQAYSNIAPGFSFQYLIPPPYQLTNIKVNNMPYFTNTTIKSHSRKHDNDFLVCVETNPGPDYTTYQSVANPLNFGDRFTFSRLNSFLDTSDITKMELVAKIHMASNPSGGTIDLVNVSTGDIYGIPYLTTSESGDYFMVIAEQINTPLSQSTIQDIWAIDINSNYPGTNYGTFALRLYTEGSNEPLSINIVGSLQDAPLWVSSVKPPGSSSGTTEAVIVGSQLESPIWTSQVKP